MTTMASPRSKRNMPRLSLPLFVLTYSYLTIVSSTHVYTDSFPPNDEYDFTVLDPHNIYGSPYGGFGRATRSRLAALPLILPGTVGEYSTENAEMYMEVRDGDGRLFACRIYHEDEVTPYSLNESMFTTAELNPLPQKDDTDEKDNIEEEAVTKEKSTEAEQVENNEVAKVSVEEQVTQALAKLNGVCTQIHRGWWSYEWCHGKKVTQFHVHVESGKTQQIEIESVTSLGDYSKSTIYTDGLPEPEDDHVGPKVQNEYTLDENEPKDLAVVVHEFDNGEMCEESGKPRQSKVTLKCCPLGKMNRLKRAVFFHGEPVASNIAAITRLKETSVCNYSIDVCTPLLCENVAELFEEGSLVAQEKKKETAPAITTSHVSRGKNENGSIREILEGTLKNVCLRFFNGGWWVYEVCHGKHVRQFHEADQFDPKSGSYARVPESIFVLGTYSKEDLEEFPDEDEPKYVTNPSGQKENQLGVTKKSGIKHNVGAYFVQEYTHGDVCDHSDVTDAAIKAGNVGEGGIERATTVRYFCGDKFEMRRVDEDSTCHYVVDISVPELCEHKLFKAPVAKKQVVKCLPVEESQANI